jgi:glycosyltransferase involved in cell wall biosynthesis
VKISIIIPHYREAPAQIAPALSSIRAQLGVDFSDIECILVSDAGDTMPADFLARFEPLQIRQIRLDKNAGPGVARQAGIESARGDYVMFIDADDCLHSVGVLGAFAAEMDKDPYPDLITSSWLEEQRIDGRWAYIQHDIDNTWVFGKAYRRDFLHFAGVAFEPSLRVHEDSYFNGLVRAFLHHTAHIPVVTYVWRWSPGTITRRNDAAYTFDSFPEYIRAMSLCLAKLERRNADGLAEKAIDLILYIFFALHQPAWIAPERADILEESTFAVGQRLAPYAHFLAEASVDTLGRMYADGRARHFAGCVEGETLQAWMIRMFGEMTAL